MSRQAGGALCSRWDSPFSPKKSVLSVFCKPNVQPVPRERSVSIHPDEALLIELRQHQKTPEGRAKLRERVAAEHTLAHVGRWQGRRARYCGSRKNLFDLRGKWAEDSDESA